VSKQPNKLLSDRVRKAAASVMQKNGGRLSYPELFIEMDILTEKNYLDWRKGRVPFLEGVITCNLSKLARIMTAVRRLAQEQGQDRVVGGKQKCRYSKSGNPHLEEEYRSTYSKRKNKQQVPQARPEAALTPVESHGGAILKVDFITETKLN